MFKKLRALYKFVLETPIVDLRQDYRYRMVTHPIGYLRYRWSRNMLIAIQTRIEAGMESLHAEVKRLEAMTSAVGQQAPTSRSDLDRIKEGYNAVNTLAQIGSKEVFRCIAARSKKGFENQIEYEMDAFIDLRNFFDMTENDLNK